MVIYFAESYMKLIKLFKISTRWSIYRKQNIKKEKKWHFSHEICIKKISLWQIKKETILKLKCMPWIFLNIKMDSLLHNYGFFFLIYFFLIRTV